MCILLHGKFGSSEIGTFRNWYVQELVRSEIGMLRKHSGHEFIVVWAWYGQSLCAQKFVNLHWR